MIYTDKTFFRFKYVEDGEVKSYLLPEEPINWDKVDIILKRDKTFHGMNYQYTDGDIQLEFAEDCGLSIIELIYSKDGSDGDIILQFGFIVNEVEQVEYEGKLNLNTYHKFKGRISCTLETTGLHELINSRSDTKINLFDIKTLDGKDKLSKDVNVVLHSKRLLKSTIVRNNPYAEIIEELHDSDNLYITFDYLNQEIGEIKEFNTSGFSVLATNPSTDPELRDDLALFKLVDGGIINFFVDVKYSISLYLQEKSGIFTGKPYFSNYRFQVVLKVTDINGLQEKHNVSLIDTGVINVDTDFIHFEFDRMTEEPVQVVVDPGDRIYIYGHITVDAHNEKAVGIRITPAYPEGDNNTIQVLKAVAQSEQVESEAKAILIYEAIESAIESITNQASSVDSEYFGRIENGHVFDGVGSRYILTNGFFIRNFDILYRGLTTSFKEIIKSLQSIFAIGVSYEFDETGKQRIKIEPQSYYYGDQEIIRIEHCSDYSEDTAKEYIYNELSIGYDKYPDSGEYLLDEYNTQLEFLTPIKTLKNKYEQRADFIASGFAIEETRREQYSTKPKDSTTYDDNIFIISVVNSEGWKSEKTENFTIENVIDPDSSYNVRITPKRNLIRHARWINSGLFFKKGFEVIRNTLFKNNGEARTKANTEAEFIKEKEDVILNNFDDRKQIFKPVWISFKCRLSFSQIHEIKSAHVQKGHPKKNGFISVKTREGIWKSGYIWDMIFNPSREEVTIKMLEKANNQEGVTCKDYSSFNFENFESTQVPGWIEDCTFANFD